MKMVNIDKRVQKIRICTKCVGMEMDFAQERRNNKKIMMVDQDFVLENTGGAQTTLGHGHATAQRQAQETREMMDKSSVFSNHGIMRPSER